jgi:acetyltransferase-like isoleucine patch superfamily enzyme
MRLTRRARGPAPEDAARFGLARCGTGSRIVGPALGVHNPASIAVGSRVLIQSHVFLEAIGMPGEVVLEIGDDTYIGYMGRITALSGVSIGRSVLIADRVYISDTGHEYSDPDIPIKDQPLRVGRRVRIDDGAWLGVGSVIVGNVHIGQNAVVGAGCVVRGDVEARTVVAGDPARVVRRYADGKWQRA